jgi:hypothetical protein
MLRIAPVLLAAVLACSSCAPAPEGDASADGDGDGDADSDTDDAPDEEVARDAEAGPLTLVIEDLGVLLDRLCDLDGDGVNDNAVADLGSPQDQYLATALSSALTGTASGSRRYLAHFPWLDDVVGPNDPDALLLFVEGKDTDEPENADDDLSGSEPFFIKDQYLDACGEPRFAAATADIRAGELAGSGGVLAVRYGETVVRTSASSLWGTIETRGSAFEAVACCLTEIHDLGVVPAEGGLSTLELFLAGGGAIGIPGMPGILPDVDLDRDGLERFVTDDDGRIVGCLDGDGTVIDGRDCWQDARIADAFALVLSMAGTSARIAGREPGWQSQVDGSCEAGMPDSSLWDAR